MLWKVQIIRFNHSIRVTICKKPDRFNGKIPFKKWGFHPFKIKVYSVVLLSLCEAWCVLIFLIMTRWTSVSYTPFKHNQHEKHYR